MKKRVIGSGVTAAVIATTMALTPHVGVDRLNTNTAIISSDLENYTTEIGYALNGDDKHSRKLIIDVPEELSIDIAVLYVNDVEVDTALIPTQPQFVSIPIVFDKLENLEIKLYRMGEEVGTARFIDGILKTDAKAVV